MQIRGEVRRVVEYETKSQKVKNPGFWFHDRDMNKQPGLLRQKKSTFVAFGNKKKHT
jgi:hypothetical protein